MATREQDLTACNKDVERRTAELVVQEKNWKGQIEYQQATFDKIRSHEQVIATCQGNMKRENEQLVGRIEKLGPVFDNLSGVITGAEKTKITYDESLQALTKITEALKTTRLTLSDQNKALEATKAQVDQITAAGGEYVRKHKTHGQQIEGCLTATKDLAAESDLRAHAAHDEVGRLREELQTLSAVVQNVRLAVQPRPTLIPKSRMAADTGIGSNANVSRPLLDISDFGSVEDIMAGIQGLSDWDEESVTAVRDLFLSKLSDASERYHPRIGLDYLTAVKVKPRCLFTYLKKAPFKGAENSACKTCTSKGWPYIIVHPSTEEGKHWSLVLRAGA